jgi:DNA invertase Pin-like site-specific DNA recombinase
MDAALKQLQAFEKEGGLGILAEQLTDGGVAPRKPGKPQNKGSESVVRELKTAGMNQSQIARETGLALSTVHRYWKRINATESRADC